MDEKTYTELNEILDRIEKEIVEKQKTVISAKAKAQIKNLIDKVDVRAKLPNFVSDMEIVIEGQEEPIKVSVTLSDFLKAINTEATKEDKQTLKNLEVRALGLKLTLEPHKPKEEPKEEPKTPNKSKGK